jgi:hypothetical protein
LVQQYLALTGENSIDAFVVPASDVFDELPQLGQILDSLSGLLADPGGSALENQPANDVRIACFDGSLELSLFPGRDQSAIGDVRGRTQGLEALGRVFGR